MSKQLNEQDNKGSSEIKNSRRRTMAANVVVVGSTHLVGAAARRLRRTGLDVQLIKGCLELACMGGYALNELGKRCKIAALGDLPSRTGKHKSKRFWDSPYGT